MSLNDETSAYQTMLEGHRMDPDSPELWADLLKARRALEVEWLETIGERHGRPDHQSS